MIAKLSRFSLRRDFLNPLKAGSWWHPHYYAWLAEKKRTPELDNPLSAAIMRAVRYSPHAVQFFREREAQHLFTHDLTSDSLVLDVGSYTGGWSRTIYTRYQPRIIAFEPVPTFHDAMTQAFANEPKVSVCNYGLSDSTRTASMDMRAMGTSEFSKGSGFPTIDVELRDVRDVFEELQIDEVDLLKVNIEGGEYPLLERMLECNLVPRCRRIMVQFHQYVMPTKKAIKWREKLVGQIERTHAPAFSFPFIWECWSRNAS